MQLDLNLLTALDMLLEEGSVGGAAFRLNLSEPAMSRTLGRIRRVTGDAILVRSGRFMTPTPYALSIREQVRAAVQQAKALLQPPEALNPATLRRVFTLRGHDALLDALAPLLTSTVTRQAPGVQLRFLSETQGRGNEELQDLRRGETDLTLGAAHSTAPDLIDEVIGQDHFVVALRRQHPLLTGTLTAVRYAAGQHVGVSRRGRLHGLVDTALAEQGLEREVVVVVPTAYLAARLAAESDFLISVPAQMMVGTLRALSLETRPLPVQIAPLPVIITWHVRTEGDAASRWFRTQVRGAAQQVLGCHTLA
ncbi:LysR family transcriptional regulator [Deinococcus altitudinis]|uniref:LysR family transcriptional regulator n=1 Tax=Deinococcus altitudinis TaxID=468914 RepID=UPI0038924C80